MKTQPPHAPILALLYIICTFNEVDADILRPTAGDVVLLGEHLEVSWSNARGELSEVLLWSVREAEWVEVDWWDRTGSNKIALLIPQSFSIGQHRVQLNFSDGAEMLSNGYFSVVRSEGSPVVSEGVTSGIEGFDVQVRFQPSARILNIEGDLDIVSRVSIVDVLGRSVVTRAVEQGDRVVLLHMPGEVAKGTYICVADLKNGSSVVVATISHVL